MVETSLCSLLLLLLFTPSTLLMMLIVRCNVRVSFHELTIFTLRSDDKHFRFVAIFKTPLRIIKAGRTGDSNFKSS